MEQSLQGSHYQAVNVQILYTVWLWGDFSMRLRIIAASRERGHLLLRHLFQRFRLIYAGLDLLGRLTRLLPRSLDTLSPSVDLRSMSSRAKSPKELVTNFISQILKCQIRHFDAVSNSTGT